MKFKTVKQVMEHYVPEKKPLTGKDLAAMLLTECRSNLRSEMAKAKR